MSGQWVPRAAARRLSRAVVDGGGVLAAGPPGADERAVASWSEVVAVPAGSLHTVGIRRNGSVLA